MTAHPTRTHLAAYADGSLSAGLSLLVAGHLTFCPACRAAVARYETLVGALLAEAEAGAVAPPSLEAALARLAAAPGRDAAAPSADDAVFPRPLRQAAGRGSGDVRWRFLLPGLSSHRLAGFAGEEVSLLRARPGARVPAHTHEGEEATLVLAGAIRDDGRDYRRGDVALADARHDHRPEIVGDETCICLVVLSGPMRFTGPVGRILNLFSG